VTDVSQADGLEARRATGPYAITAGRNFGAGGRCGAIDITTSAWSDLGRALWERLDAHVRCLRAAYDPGWRTVIVCHRPTEVGALARDADIIAHRNDQAAWPEGNEPSRFLNANLADPVALAEIEHKLLAEEEPKLLLVGAIVEHLADPRPLLRVVRRFLKRHPESRLVIATLDRTQVETSNLSGRCWRLWDADEIAVLLTGSGFELLPRGPARSDSSVVISEAKCTPAWYDGFLQQHGFPASSTRLVLVSANWEACETTNIERWIAESERAGWKPPVVLTLGGPFATLKVNTGLRASDFAEWANAWLAPEAAMEAVLHVVFLYDELEQIEFPDYGGCFFRVSQAKRSGLLPPAVATVVVCHGSNFYAEHVSRGFQPPDRNLMHLWEKIAIELADCVLFPSEYMRRLILEQLALRPLGTVYTHRLPFMYSSGLDTPHSSVIDTIVFVGDQRGANGWNEFSEAAQALANDASESGPASIRRIVVIGAKGDGAPIASPEGISVEEINAPPESLYATLRAVADRSVVVIPWSPCGQAYPLLQAVDAGCYVVAMQAGGVEELVPAPLREQIFCAPSGSSLLAGLREALALSLPARCARLADLRKAMRCDQDAVNASWRGLRLQVPSVPRAGVMRAAESPVTVVVPVYNRPYGEIAELIVGLNSQSLKPREVIFVDDASRQDFAAEYANRIRSSLAVPARFIRHTTNKGLSGARNSGLWACTTEFIAVHDSDNIAVNDFLYCGCLTMLRNPQLDAVTFLLATFWDEDDWSTYNPQRDRYCPIGDGLVQSLSDINWIGDAMAVYRTSVLRELGGWDESSTAMWEDLALFLKMLARKRRVMNAPRYEVLYRIRPDSMLRTGSQHAARQRMAHSVDGLTPFDAFALQRIMLGARSSETRHEGPTSGRELLRAAARRYVARRPKTRAVVRMAMRLVRHGRAAFALRGRARGTPSASD
jgi:hypothetical protein